MKYTIREINYEDAEQVARVQIQSWRETYKGIIHDDYLDTMQLDGSVKRWQQGLSKNVEMSWDFAVETEHGEIVGFLSGGKARIKVEGYKGEIYAIYVLKEHQGNGLGFLLIKKLCTKLLENGVSNMIVLVLENNSTKNFYMKYGAKLIKKLDEKIGKQDLIEEVYGWDNLNFFFKD